MPLQIIHPREIKLVGELTVKRILPFRERRMVGPFIFLDEMDARITADDSEGTLDDGFQANSAARGASPPSRKATSVLRTVIPST